MDKHSLGSSATDDNSADYSFTDRLLSHKNEGHSNMTDQVVSLLEHKYSKAKKDNKWKIALCTTTIFIILLPLSLFIRLQIKRSGHQSSLKDENQCGSSPQEARLRGCHYEPMMSAWIPDKCYFPEIADLYQDLFDVWGWYTDVNVEPQNRISDPEQMKTVRAGEYVRIFTDAVNAHNIHCMYSWQKVSYALHKGRGWIDKRSLAFHHSAHCATAAIMEFEPANITSVLREKDIEMEGTFNATEWPLMYHDCVSMLSLIQDQQN